MDEQDERLHRLGERRRELFDKLKQGDGEGGGDQPSAPPGYQDAPDDGQAPPDQPGPGWNPAWPPAGMAWGQSPWGQTPWAQNPWGQAPGMSPGAAWPGFGAPAGPGAGFGPAAAAPGGWGAWQGASAPVDKEPLVKIKPGGDKPPFFCIHAILGSVFPYHRLSLHLERDRPLYGIQARGLFPGEEPRETIEEMADAYVAEIRRVAPRGPYHLGGYSFGGWVAWEMARRLGDEVGVLAVFGVPIPATAVWPALGAQADYLLRYAADWQRLVRNSAMAEGRPGWEAQLSPSQRVVWANGWAQARWVPKQWNGRLDLFLTSEQAAIYADDHTMGWNRLCTGQTRAHHIEGNHLNLFESPQVEVLARDLVARMQETEGST